MPEEAKKDDLESLTPEQLAEELRKTKAELAAVGTIEVKDGDKSEKVDLRTEEGRKRAAQLASGGLHISQRAAELNQREKALKEAEAKVKSAAGQAGQPADAAANRKRVREAIKADPKLAQLLDDGESAAFLERLGEVLDTATPEAPAHAERPAGDTISRDEARRLLAYETRVLPDKRFQLLAAKLGRGNAAVGAKLIAEAHKAKMDAGAIDPDADFATSLLQVAHEWADDFGLKVEDAKPAEPTEDVEPDKGTPPTTSQPGAGAAPTGEPPKFNSRAEYVKYQQEQAEKARKGGQVRKHSWNEGM